MLKAFFELGTSNLSGQEKMLLSRKLPMIAANIMGDDQIFAKIVEGIDSKTLRSKLITLVMSFSHSAMVAGFVVVEQNLLRSSTRRPPDLTLAQLKGLVKKADALVKDIISQSRLALH